MSAVKSSENVRRLDANEFQRAVENLRGVDTDELRRAVESLRGLDTDELRRGVENYRAFDADEFRRAVENFRSVDIADFRRVVESLKMLSASMESPRPEKLVPESALDEVAEDEDEVAEEPPTQAEPPVTVVQLVSALTAQEFTPSIRERRHHDLGFIVDFDLPAGRSTRSVAVPEELAPTLLKYKVSDWRSLQRYDGVWSGRDGMIEVTLRGSRFGPPSSSLMRRLTSLSVKEELPAFVETVEPESDIVIRIGQPSELAKVLLSPRDRYPSRPPRLTLTISNVDVTTTERADDLAEEVADSLSFDLYVRLGTFVTLQRLENRDVVARRRRRTMTRELVFPRNRYPHAPIILFEAGLERHTAPLIRYWAFYQVLEYFYPRHASAEALSRLSRHLRSPAFSPFRDEDLLKAVELAAVAGGSGGTELEQLRTTLDAIVTPREIVQLTDDLDLGDQIARKSELTDKTIRLSTEDNLISDLSARIYDIRCRIVHSKSSGQRDGGPSLLPGTHHDDLVLAELPLMEFLAEQALTTSAEALTIPPRKFAD